MNQMFVFYGIATNEKRNVKMVEKFGYRSFPIWSASQSVSQHLICFWCNFPIRWLKGKYCFWTIQLKTFGVYTLERWMSGFSVQPVKINNVAAAAASSHPDAQLLQSLYTHYKFRACNKHIIIDESHPCRWCHTSTELAVFGRNMVCAHSDTYWIGRRGYNSIITKCTPHTTRIIVTSLLLTSVNKISAYRFIKFHVRHSTLKYGAH